MFKPVKKILKRKMAQPQGEFQEEEFEEELVEEPRQQEPPMKELPPTPEPPKQKVSKPNRVEIEDMIEGHLVRASELLRLLRGAE